MQVDHIPQISFLEHILACDEMLMISALKQHAELDFNNDKGV